MLRILEAGEQVASKLTVGGDGRSFYTRAIPLDRLEAPYTVEVQYRDGPGAPVRLHGRYALDLAELERSGLVRIEQQRTGQVIRLIVQQRRDGLYLQLNQAAPSLRLPRSENA
jgi:hypothetical protein